MKQVTALYRALAGAFELRIVERGLTMQACDDGAGLADGHCAKLLHPAAPSGRQGSWFCLDLLARLLYPAGYDIRVIPRDADTSPYRQARPPRELAADLVSRRNLRCRLAEEFGRVGGRVRSQKLSPERRREIAAIAARARWQRRRRP